MGLFESLTKNGRKPNSPLIRQSTTLILAIIIYYNIKVLKKIL